jgi:phosphocarrier protein
MTERTVTIGSSTGLHARPASLFAQAAAKAGVPVTLTAGGTTINAASILAVLSLGVSHGDSVTIASDAVGSEAAVETLAELLASDLDAA